MNQMYCIRIPLFLSKAFLLLLFLTTAFFSCKKHRVNEVENLNGNDITILGHGGMGDRYKYPGNTYESVEPVLRIGSAGTELDVQLTKDSVLVLYHDPYLNVKTGCDGMIYDHDFAEIGGCKYTAISTHIYLIALENLFSRIPDLESYTFSLDCKLYRGDIPDPLYFGQWARELKRVMEKFGLTHQILIESSNEEFLRTLISHNIEARLMAAGTGSVDKSLEMANSMNLYGIGMDMRRYTKEDVLRIHKEGFRVMLWGLKTHGDNIQAIKMNPDIVQTDKPIHMLKQFNRYDK